MGKTRDRFFDLLAGFVLRCLFVAGLVVLMGSGRCASTGEGVVRAEKVNSGLDSSLDSLDKLGAAVDRSNATPQEKAQMKDLIGKAKAPIKEAKPAIKKLGQDVDTNKADADANAKDAGNWRLLIWILRIAGIVLLGLGIWKLGPKIPILGKFLPWGK